MIPFCQVIATDQPDQIRPVRAGSTVAAMPYNGDLLSVAPGPCDPAITVMASAHRSQQIAGVILDGIFDTGIFTITGRSVAVIPGGSFPVVAGKILLHTEQVVASDCQAGMTPAALQDCLGDRDGGEDSGSLIIVPGDRSDRLNKVRFFDLPAAGG